MFCISSLKSVGKRDVVGYGKQKAKKFEADVTSSVASVFNLNENGLCSDAKKEWRKVEIMYQPWKGPNPYFNSGELYNC